MSYLLNRYQALSEVLPSLNSSTPDNKHTDLDPLPPIPLSTFI